MLTIIIEYASEDISVTMCLNSGSEHNITVSLSVKCQLGE